MAEAISVKRLTANRPTPKGSMTPILVGVVVVAALYFGREVLVPIALAILLSFVLSPLVRLLQRGHFPRSVGMITVGLVAFAAIFGLQALMIRKSMSSNNLPRYQATFGPKIDSLRGATAGTDTLKRASRSYTT